MELIPLPILKLIKRINSVKIMFVKNCETDELIFQMQKRKRSVCFIYYIYNFFLFDSLHKCFSFFYLPREPWVHIFYISVYNTFIINI